MPQIDINTTQNVLITHPAASIGKRMLAQLIDLTVIIFYSIFVSFVAGLLANRSTAIMIILFLPVIFYSFLSELFFQGQSLGKMALNIRVVKLDGAQPSVIDYFIRWIFRIIDIPFYGSVAIITIAINGKGQRLGDLAAGTTVIDTSKKTNINTSIYRKLPDDYQLQFKEVEKLDEKDIKIINKVLNHHKKNFSRETANMLINAKDAIIKKTGIKTTMPPRPFIQTIIKDYNYLIKKSLQDDKI
jgi:uncharacterized RDD family membrane protein YckC